MDVHRRDRRSFVAVAEELHSSRAAERRIDIWYPHVPDPHAQPRAAVLGAPPGQVTVFGAGGRCEPFGETVARGAPMRDAAGTSGRRRARTRLPGTRGRIVAAAIDLFGRNGYAGTSIVAIAEQVGITDAGVLYHFPTKLDLFTAVVDEFTRVQAERFRALLAPGGLGAISNLRVWGEAMEARPDLLAAQTALSAEAIAPGAELHAYWASRHGALLELIARLFVDAVERGEVRSDVDPRYEASALAAQLDGLRLQWFYSDGAVSIATAFDTYVSQLVARIALRRPAATPRTSG